MTGYCPHCKDRRNLIRVPAPVGTVAFRCKLCNTVIPVGDQPPKKEKP